MQVVNNLLIIFTEFSHPPYDVGICHFIDRAGEAQKNEAGSHSEWRAELALIPDLGGRKEHYPHHLLGSGSPLPGRDTEWQKLDMWTQFCLLQKRHFKTALRIYRYMLYIFGFEVKNNFLNHQY